MTSNLGVNETVKNRELNFWKQFKECQFAFDMKTNLFEIQSICLENLPPNPLRRGQNCSYTIFFFNCLFFYCFFHSFFLYFCIFTWTIPKTIQLSIPCIKKKNLFCCSLSILLNLVFASWFHNF